MGIANFAAGWLLGAKVGNQGFDEVLAAARAILESKEFADFAAAVRTHVAFVLRELSDLVDADQGVSPDDDVIETVRKLIQRRDQALSSAQGTTNEGKGAVAEVKPFPPRPTSAPG
ncbi:MAG: hypothetical protein ACRDZO_05050 [Egibacteraceae bacterium]